MGLFTPIYMKSGLNGQQREKALKKLRSIDDPGKLAAIARTAADPDIGVAAINKLQDAAALAELALEATDPRIRIAAVENRHQENVDLLARIARHDADAGVRTAAVEALVNCAKYLYDQDGARAARLLAELGDEDALARLAMVSVAGKGSDLKALSPAIKTAVDAVQSQSVLERIARDASANYARLLAIRRLENRALLSEIAQKHVWVPVGESAYLEGIGLDVMAVPACEAAVDRLIELDGDNAMRRVAGIVQDAGDASARRIALKKLVESDRASAMESLADVAVRCADYHARDAAVKRLAEWGDDALLVRVASAGKPPAGDNHWNFTQTCLAAVRSIRSRDVLTSLAKTAPNESVRSVAAEQLGDPSLIAELARDDAGWLVRSSAAEQLDDPAALADIVRKDASNYVRKTAARNPHLTDAALLARVAREDADCSVREAAIRNPNLVDPGVLEEVALRDESVYNRIYAVDRLKDPDALARIAGAGQEKGDVPRWLAAVRLSRIAPERAVEPLVRRMKLDRGTSFDNGATVREGMSEKKTIRALRQEAADFLADRYANTGDPDVRRLIASLPDGDYGSNDKYDGWTKEGRENQVVRFHLSR